MSQVTLDHIESEHARIGALIEQFKQQAVATEYVIERTVIPLPAGARVAGPIFKEDGALDYYLILHKGESSDVNHAAAKAYVGDRGFKLPNRREGRLLQAAFPEFCAEGSMWLEEDYEPDPAYAWYQNYDYGNQNGYRESAELRAVAVSRFIPSVI
ncbi:hypothetical protein LMG24238_06949 [Paraburkholderia sediminicola]|uniref:DUF1566 domain-containing protein n=1 Tax=Paraburkholderia sediminicola TaxID=458836 RepID=A0A6J5CR77_9BURK|nr:DUF1566 domain-containing protein [Paraburkholderia sediminicola]CAB3742844.1 hypothetical protein LMG24238_06949 [Paraburkholderia sediminicola]